MTPQFQCSSFADASYPHILVPSCWRVLRSRRIAQGWKYRMFVYFIVPKGVILIGNKPFSCWPKKLFVYVSALTAWPVWAPLLFLSFSFTTAWLSYPTSTYIRLAVLFLQILSGRDQVGTFNDFFIKFQNYVFFMTWSTIHFYRNTMYFYGKQCISIDYVCTLIMGPSVEFSVLWIPFYQSTSGCLLEQLFRKSAFFVLLV